jgi:PAS domain S-box-containing protein
LLRTAKISVTVKTKKDILALANSYLASHYYMDHSKKMDFTTSKSLTAALKTAVRSYVFGSGQSIILADYLVPFEFLVSNNQSGTAIAELEKLQESLIGTAESLISLYLEDRPGEAQNGLELFDLKADNLLLRIEVLELKSAPDNTAQNTDLQTHTNEKTAYRELTEDVAAINSLFIEKPESQDAVQKKLDMYFSQAPVGICILKGPDLIVELANNLYLQLVDRDENLLNRPLFDTLAEIKEQPVEHILREVYASGNAHTANEVAVYLVRNNQPDLSYFNFVYQPIFEDNGDVAGIIIVCTEVTGMVSAKSALAAKEKEFRHMVMQSPIAMTIFRGRDLIIEIANQAMLTKLWRMEFHEVVGKSILDVFPELVEQGYAELLHNVTDSGTLHRASESPAYIDSHDGRKLYYLDYEYLPFIDPDGTVGGIMCTVNDVTDRVKARQLEEIAQKRHAHLIETLPVAMYTTDANGYIDLYNQAAATLWGRKPEPGIDRWCGSYKLTTLEGVPVPHDECPMAMAYKEGRSIEEEIYMYRNNGERRHVIVHPQPLYGESGEIIGASKVMIDITDRKEAEEQVRKSEEKFRLLSESIPQFIWMSDANGVLDYFSNSVFNYSGLTHEEASNGGWIDIVHPEDREENIRRWQHAVATGEDFFMEHRFRRHDGKYRWQLSRATAQKNSKGEILQWVGTSTDIDDQKTFQKTLETLVEERTNELRKANHELESMNKELSSFAYISSHDLQEPLRKIQTFGSIILANEHANLSDSGKKNFSRMQLAADRMTKLIQDLLTYSRTNNTEKAFEQVDLDSMLKDIKAEFYDTLEDRNASLIIGSMPPVNAIAFQMRQLFNNLISNALKFSKEGVAPVITISSDIVKGAVIGDKKADTNKDYLHIAVADNGIGFSPEYASRIFEVFQRLHGKTEYEGTGIGLAICMKIAENHDAIINASSQPGNGAVFNIYFPLN